MAYHRIHSHAVWYCPTCKAVLWGADVDMQNTTTYGAPIAQADISTHLALPTDPADPMSTKAGRHVVYQMTASAETLQRLAAATRTYTTRAKP